MSRLFPSRSGTYVDVGAYDPTEFSNTRHFYDLGWTGLNIEPAPERFRRFEALRRRDVNVNVGIAATSGMRQFYELDPPTLSTFDADEASRCASFPGHRIAATHQIEVRPLREVLAERLPGARIDFMTIDTEGYEGEVLRSNDWERFRPLVLLIEHRRYHPDGLIGSSSERWEPFLLAQRYVHGGSNPVNAIYVRGESPELVDELSSLISRRHGWSR